MKYLLDNLFAKQFIFGKKSEFTVVNTDTRKRFTFRLESLGRINFSSIKSWSVESKMEKATKFLGYAFLAESYSVGKRLGSFTSRLQDSENPNKHVSKCADAFFWFICNIDSLPKNIEIYHIGKCCMCGRKLTTPKSIKAGIGPICEKIHE